MLEVDEGGNPVDPAKQGSCVHGRTDAQQGSCRIEESGGRSPKGDGSVDPFSSATASDIYVGPRGPRGGKLLNPVLQTHNFSEFNGDVLPDGTLPLHRKPGPAVAMTVLKNEQPWHRMAAYMLLNNCTNIQIAEAAGVTPQAVSILRSQLWFQQLLAKLATRDGEEITAAIRSYALESVEGIHEIATSSESDRVRLSAWTTLLEHANGKPVQKNLNLSSNISYSTPEDERADLLSQLESLAKARATAEP